MQAVPVRPDEAGFTLIELLISLALFALIAGAGVALVDGVLGIQSRTAARLERLGDLQRAVFVLGNDLAQAQGGPIESDGAAASVTRPLAALGGAPLPVVYALAGTDLIRRPTAAGPQRLLTGVSGLRWRFFRRDVGWVDRWPPQGLAPGQRPAAIAVDLALAAAPGLPSGSLRRIVALPVTP